MELSRYEIRFHGRDYEDCGMSDIMRCVLAEGYKSPAVTYLLQLECWRSKRLVGLLVTLSKPECHNPEDINSKNNFISRG